jgi:hypothetical protein
MTQKAIWKAEWLAKPMEKLTQQGEVDRCCFSWWDLRLDPTIPLRDNSYKKIYKVLGARLLSPFMPLALGSAER